MPSYQYSFWDDKDQVRPLAHISTSKRQKNERHGLHAWHTYYAGYSEQFVFDILDTLAKDDSLVLDPWNGSGTTTLVAQRCGLNSIGVEINPAMALHAQAKNLGFTKDTDQIHSLAETIVSIVNDNLGKGTLLIPEYALDWVNSEPLTALLLLRDQISTQTTKIAPPLFLADVEQRNSLNPSDSSKLRAFLFSALFQVLRKVGNFQQGSNPTWLKLNKHENSVSAQDVLEQYLYLIESMLSDLKATSAHTDKLGEYWVMTGNSRQLNLRENTVDLIVTSPPYCTRIDYAVATKPELILLGYSVAEIDNLRKRTMGAPVIANKTLSPQASWGKLCNKFLEQVASHPSKASKSYYLPTYLQYFDDVECSLRELYRVMKSHAEAVIVVQSSFYKDIEIPLGEIYVEMSQTLGFDAQIAKRETIRQHMAHVNSKSRQYVKNKVYYEDAVLLHK